MKKFSLLIFVFLISISLTSCFNKWDTNTDTQTWSTDSQNNTQAWDNLQKIVGKISNEYKNDEMFLSCVETSIWSCLFPVVQQKATEKNDTSVCSELADFNLEDWCKAWITTSLAISAWTIDKCNELEWNNKDNCISQVTIDLAVKWWNPELCKEYIKVESDTWTWDLLNQSKFYLDNCINSASLQLAMTKKDVKYCMNLQNKFDIDSCVQNVKNIIEMEKNLNEQ